MLPPFCRPEAGSMSEYLLKSIEDTSELVLKSRTNWTICSTKGDWNMAWRQCSSMGRSCREEKLPAWKLHWYMVNNVLTNKWSCFSEATSLWWPFVVVALSGFDPYRRTILDKVFCTDCTAAPCEPLSISSGRSLDETSKSSRTMLANCAVKTKGEEELLLLKECSPIHSQTQESHMGILIKNHVYPETLSCTHTDTNKPKAVQCLWGICQFN